MQYRLVLPLLLLLVAGCGSEMSDGLSTSDFEFIDSETTIDNVFDTLGHPDGDVGSGLYVYEYLLIDGSAIRVGSSDGSSVLYVRHGENTLYPATK